jgi:hypothetical protein
MLDLRENDKIEGWMSHLELLWLYERAKEMDTIAELGSYQGRSTFALCSGCKGQVFAIDNFSMTGEMPGGRFSSGRQSLDKNVGHFNNLTVLEGKSAEFTRPVDMVFIDADHEYESVRDDIKAWLPNAKKLICGHDWDWEGVRKAVLESMGKPDEIIDSIWIKWIK